MYRKNLGQSFLVHYKRNCYDVVAPSSLMDPSVPMTFVGSAGLAQVEGAIQHGDNRTDERYVLVQPCFRHFDVQKVGTSPLHLSLFLMGGAFQFGEVTRHVTLDAIWTFLIDNLKLDPSHIWATVFAGGELEDQVLAEDTKTYCAWREIGLSEKQLVKVGVTAGYWKQGGGLLGYERHRKCGPTTELFFDRGDKKACSTTCRPGCPCGRFVEIANVLFIHHQYDQSTHTLRPLLTPFDEVVIGIERLQTTLYGCETVFDLPDLAPLVRMAKQRRTAWRHSDRLQETMSAQIIADHIRALLFLTSDGAPPPGKGGRARIMRTLIRDVLTHQQILGVYSSTSVPELVDLAIRLNEKEYPHLRKGHSVLLNYFDIEQISFSRTLSRGFQQIDRVLLNGRDNTLSGVEMLKIVKEYGVPLPLLARIVHLRGLNLDMQEYRQAQEAWRNGSSGT